MTDFRTHARTHFTAALVQNLGDDFAALEAQMNDILASMTLADDWDDETAVEVATEYADKLARRRAAHPAD
jgi:hypothetical protein